MSRRHLYIIGAALLMFFVSMDAVSVTAGVPSTYYLQVNATGPGSLEEAIRGIFDSIIGVFLVFGIIGGVAGIVIYIAIGLLELHLFTSLLGTAGGRKIVHALQGMIVIPAAIGILFMLDQFAIQGLLGSSVDDVGSFAWMMHQIWTWIASRITNLFT